MDTKLSQDLALNAVEETNLKVPGTENTYISSDAEGSNRNTYRKVISDSGRIPTPGNDSETIQTITITRTLLSNQ